MKLNEDSGWWLKISHIITYCWWFRNPSITTKKNKKRKHVYVKPCKKWNQTPMKTNKNKCMNWSDIFHEWQHYHPMMCTRPIFPLSGLTSCRDLETIQHLLNLRILERWAGRCLGKRGRFVSNPRCLLSPCHTWDDLGWFLVYMMEIDFYVHLICFIYDVPLVTQK